MTYDRIVAAQFDFSNHPIVSPSNGSWAIEPIVQTFEGGAYLMGIRIVILQPVHENTAPS